MFICDKSDVIFNTPSDHNAVNIKIAPEALSTEDRFKLEVFLNSVLTQLSLNDADSRRSLSSLVYKVNNSSNETLKKASERVCALLEDYLQGNDSSKAASLMPVVATTLKNLQ